MPGQHDCQTSDLNLQYQLQNRRFPEQNVPNSRLVICQPARQDQLYGRKGYAGVRSQYKNLYQRAGENFGSRFSRNARKFDKVISKNISHEGRD